MKILLTGANGFIGKNLKEKLVNIYDMEYPARNQLNLLDAGAVEDYLRAGCFDVVIHAANTNNTKRQSVSPYDSLDGNLRMFFNLERCKKLYGKMYYFGSGAEYDAEHYIPNMTEDYFDSYVPREAYAFSKYIMSKCCDPNGNIYDLRLFGVYGKYEEWHRRFISNAICRVLKNLPITLSQNVYFDYLWVDDLAEIIKWFLENEPKYRHYNVCSGRKIDLYTLACKVKEILDTDCDIIVEKPGFKKEYTGCNRRLKDEMGEMVFREWEETIKELSRYYRENNDMIDERMLV